MQGWSCKLRPCPSIILLAGDENADEINKNDHNGEVCKKKPKRTIADIPILQQRLECTDTIVVT